MSRFPRLAVSRAAVTLLLLALLLAALPALAQGTEVRVRVNLRLRAEPSTNAAVLAVIPRGTCIPALAISADRQWVQVSYSGTNGWAATRYIQIEQGTLDALSGGAPAPAPAQVAASDQANAILALANQQRAAAGVGPLALNGLLNAAAQRHSDDMAAHSALSHTGSDGSDPARRASEAGYGWSVIGENAAQRWDVSAEGVMAQWMNSPGHRDNLLCAEFSEMGLAYAVAADGAVYYTMALGAR